MVSYGVVQAVPGSDHPAGRAQATDAARCRRIYHRAAESGARCRRLVSRDGNAVGADCGHESVERKQTAVSGRWHALTSNWREITSYNSRFYLDISVGFILLSETVATPFIQSDDRPNSIARLFQLSVLQGGLLRDAKTEAERCYRSLHLQKVQHDGASVVGHPIQFYGLERTA